MLIHYLNTDLDLVATEDPSSLVAALRARGVFNLYNPEGGTEGPWYVTFETNRTYANPDPNICALLKAIESLADNERRIWQSALKREFNIGYDCGDNPWAFNQGLENETLKRMAAVGATLRITIYPVSRDDEEVEIEDPSRLGRR